ncbi:MAG: hypothetical protein ACR2OH_00535 [Microthrixaceae bacterium]
MDLDRSRQLEEMVSEMDRADLSVLAGMVSEEQQRRALDAEDLDVVTEDAFANGFDGRGMAVDPWITPGGLLVCPGSKIHRSKQSHRCRFVAVGERWVWDAQERLCDEVRQFPQRTDSIQTVTILAAVDGLVIDLVSSKASGGVHTRESAHAWKVHAGELEPTAPSGGSGGNHSP